MRNWNEVFQNKDGEDVVKINVDLENGEK